MQTDIIIDGWGAFMGTTATKPDVDSRQTLFCQTCGQTYQATIGKVGWNRCKHCKTVHDAAALLTKEQFVEWITRKMKRRAQP